MDLPQAWPPFVFLATDYAPCNRLVFLVLGDGSVLALTPFLSAALTASISSSVFPMSSHLRLSLLKHGRGRVLWLVWCTRLAISGTIECFFLNHAGVAVLSSQLSCKCIHMCLSMYMCVQVCACALHVQIRFTTGSQADDAAVALVRHICYDEYFGCVSQHGMLIVVARAWDCAEHMHGKCRVRGSVPGAPELTRGHLQSVHVFSWKEKKTLASTLETINEIRFRKLGGGKVELETFHDSGG